MSSDKHSALSSLTATYTDSEDEHDSDVEMDKPTKDNENTSDSSHSSSDDKYIPKSKNSLSKLVSYSEEHHEEEESDSDSRSVDFEIDDDDSGESQSLSSSKVPPLSPISFHRSLMSLKKEDIKLPPEPVGRCSKSLQEKISELYEKTKQGKDMNASIQKRKDFRNPSIYEKLITYCNIDERGTNYPPEIYDPHCWGPESFYEELAKRQKEEMDKREKEKKERTKVEFISGTAKKPQTETSAGISEVTFTRKQEKCFERPRKKRKKKR